MEPRYRVLIHVDEGDPAKHAAVLRNVANLLDDLGADQTQIEIVAHGLGLDLLTNASGYAAQVGALHARGVMLAACHNTLRERQIDPVTLLPGVIIVPSGIGELVRRQQGGWLYVRP